MLHIKKKFTLKKIVKSTGDFAIITEKLKTFCCKIWKFVYTQRIFTLKKSLIILSKNILLTTEKFIIFCCQIW